MQSLSAIKKIQGFIMIRALAKILSSVALFGALSMNAQALVVNFEGGVSDVTGAFIGIFFPPLPTMSGFIEYKDTAVAAGLAGPSDILAAQVNIGTTVCIALDLAGCAPGFVKMPITSIDAAAVTFSGGSPTGGSVAFTGNLTRPVVLTLPLIFDFNAATWIIDGGLFGAVTGCYGGLSGPPCEAVSEVPTPAAAWLFGSALLGLGAMKRKKT